MRHLYILVIVGAVIIATGVVIWDRVRLRLTFRTLEHMLDDALAGTFTPAHYNESHLSKFEIKLSRYLSHCGLSSQRLAADRKNLQELVAILAHQTKTPVANILLYAELLQEQQTTEIYQESVPMLMAQAKKLQLLMESFTKMGRMVLDEIAMYPRSAPILPCIDAAVQQVRPEANAKNITFTLPDEQIILSIKFDPKWTQEALFNILDNAVKYTPSGGHIAVSVIEYEMFCRIDITDTGSGIASDELGQIFTRFYRSPAAADASGVGLGLYLARKIISAQGGYVKVSSVLRQGSTFSVFLPQY